MRVLFWSELFWPYIGGAEIFATNLLTALRKRGHDVRVVTRRDSPALDEQGHYQGIPIHRFSFWTAFANRSLDELIRARRGLADLKRAFQPDLVHIHGFGPSVVFHLDTIKAHPAPLLLTLVEERPYTEGQELLRRTLQAARWITAKSAAVLEQVRQFAPETESRSSIIYNGLEPPPLFPAPLPTDFPRLLCLGRLNVQKGFDLAISALALIIEHFPDARLIIAGDGPERSALELHAARLGVSSAVDFLGWISPHDVPGLLNTVSTVIIPSRWEGLPSVVLQAGIMARPVIATRVSGLSEVVVDGQTGVLVDPEDSTALAEAMRFLLASPRAAVRFGEAGRKRVQEAFAWKRCVDEYENLWQKLAADSLVDSSPAC